MKKITYMFCGKAAAERKHISHTAKEVNKKGLFLKDW